MQMTFLVLKLRYNWHKTLYELLVSTGWFEICTCSWCLWFNPRVERTATQMSREVQENKPKPFQQATWEDPIAVPYQIPTLVCSQNLVTTAFIPQKLIQRQCVRAKRNGVECKNLHSVETVPETHADQFLSSAFQNRGRQTACINPVLFLEDNKCRSPANTQWRRQARRVWKG